MGAALVPGQKAAQDSGSATGGTFAATLPANITAGNLVACASGNDTSGGATTTGVSDTANTYNINQGSAQANNTTAQQRIDGHYKQNVVGGVATVTATYSVSCAFRNVHAAEFAGALTASPLDQTAGATGNSTNYSSGAKTTTTDGQIIFGAEGAGAGTINPGSGFTTLVVLSTRASEYQIQSGSGSVAATFTGSTSQFCTIMMTFKAVPSGSANAGTRIANKNVGPMAQRYRFRGTTKLDTTVANVATTASDSFSSAAAATATFTTQSSAAVPFSSAGVATATFATASSASTAFSSAGVATATFNAQSSVAVAFSSAGAATATFTTQSGAQSPMAAAGVATATFTTQSSVATPFAIAGAATATFSAKAGASADFTMSGTATAVFTATTGASSTADAFMAGSATANFAAASLAPSAFTVSGQATVLFRGQAVTPNQRPYLQWGKRPPAHETYDEEILALSHAMGSYLLDMVDGRYVSKAKIKLGKKAH